MDLFVKDIRNLIIDSYQTYFYLIYITQYKPGGNLAFYMYPYIKLYNYFIKNLKMHLALNIFKIYYDKNSKALTINTLNEHVKIKFKKDRLKKYETRISTIRKQSLAHNDKEKDDSKITLNELYLILIEIRKNYNKLCENIQNSKKISNMFIGKLRTEASVAVQLLYGGLISKGVKL